MSNQQETVNLFELGWFCGFVDGEGAIGISMRNRTTNKDEVFQTPKPHLQISNTEYELIERCMYFCESIGAPYHISTQIPKKPNRKIAWVIVVAGQQRVMKILPLIAPYLQGIKREKANLVMDYCKSRETRKKGAGYTDKEKSIINTLYDLNLRGTGEQAPQRLHAKQLNC